MIEWAYEVYPRDEDLQHALHEMPITALVARMAAQNRLSRAREAEANRQREEMRRRRG